MMHTQTPTRIAHIGPPMSDATRRACLRWLPRHTVRQLFDRRARLGDYLIVRGRV